jgi:toxin ParE1/3/4
MSAAADRDFDGILDWTAEHFGEARARFYEETITEALTSLRRGPSIRGARSRGEPGEEILLLRVSRGKRRTRHIIFFRVADSSSHELEVLRILHDAMDFSRHLPKP